MKRATVVTMPERYKSLTMLVDMLADGRWHSGQDLGNRLGISRAAVWKHLSHLKDLGLPLESVTGRGYRVSNPSLALNARRIESYLQPRTRALSTVNVFPILTSSNDWLLNRAWPATGALDVCAVDCQTSGRGRRGRQWQTPFGASVALSVSRRFECGIAAMGPLGLVVALIVKEAIENLGKSGLSVKWPNDILADGNKLCGVLIEMSGEISGPVRAVIGIGINVALPESFKEGQPWTDLKSIGDGDALDRNELVGLLLNALDVGLSEFEQHGFSAFDERWQNADLLNGKEINVQEGERQYRGRARGVTADGCLRVETGDGVRAVSAADVSVRRA